MALKMMNQLVSSAAPSFLGRPSQRPRKNGLPCVSVFAKSFMSTRYIPPSHLPGTLATSLEPILMGKDNQHSYRRQAKGHTRVPETGVIKSSLSEDASLGDWLLGT